MNKKLMLTAVLVLGVLVAPAAKADHVVSDRPSDWCRHYCSLLDWLGDLTSVLGNDATDRAASDKALTDRPSDRSGRDIPTDATAKDRYGVTGSGVSDSTDGASPDPICLGCSGLPTPKDSSD